MALVPVFCDNCGAVFATASMIGGSGGSNITLIGNKVGPCPNCQGMGSVPDGVYNLVDDTLQVVTSLGALSSDRLQRLLRIIETAASTQAQPDEVVAKVEAEDPDLAPVVNLIIKQSGGQNWQQWLLILLTLLQVLFGYLQVQQQTLSGEQIERIAERVAEELQANPQKPGGQQP